MTRRFYLTKRLRRLDERVLGRLEARFPQMNNPKFLGQSFVAGGVVFVLLGLVAVLWGRDAASSFLVTGLDMMLVGWLAILAFESAMTKPASLVSARRDCCATATSLGTRDL